MLRFTKQVDYGLMAMQYIAANQGDGVIGVRRIAGEFRIPPERWRRSSSVSHGVGS